MSELVRTYASDPCDEPVAWKTNVIPREEEDDLKHFFKIEFKFTHEVVFIIKQIFIPKTRTWEQRNITSSKQTARTASLDTANNNVKHL